MEIIALGFVALVAASIAVYSLRSTSRQHAAWQSLARKLDLECVGGRWGGGSGMYGDYRGVSIYVKHTTEQSGGDTHTYTVIECPLHIPARLELEVYREGFFEKFGEFLGGQDIQVGDPDLDNTFVIKGSAPREIAAILTAPDVKRALLHARQGHPSLKVQGGSVWLKTPGACENTRQLKNYIDVVVDLALALDE